LIESLTYNLVMDDASPLSRAVRAAGGPSALGAHLGISPQAISQWQRVPAERVLAVEGVSGVPAHELRPDLYRAPPSEAA
jgi:DNA-binding transcriptional regulator YdaS (Cro superfamily)